VTEAIGFALAIGLVGAALHFALGRAGRRLPRWLARRRGEAVGPHAPRERLFAIAALLGQGAVWLGAAWLVSERFMVLMTGRERAGDLVARSLQAPLFTMGEEAWSALDLLVLPALLLAVWVAVGAVVQGLRVAVLAPAGIEVGPQQTIAVLVRYLATFVGAVVVLQAWGVDLRSLAILASVIGVGIGFGLQNIANNFVSGILINLGRPIRPGDFVEVGAFSGTVEGVGPRSTAIRTLDNVTLLVPNARFLEQEVINWSHGDPLSRVHVPVGVAYGSDVARVRLALLEVARGHPGVEREPRPQVQLRRFGESSLDFELLVWTRDPRNQFALVSDLNLRIEEAFRRHGVQIPFPQRDLHLRSRELERLVAALAPGAPAPGFAPEPDAAVAAAACGPAAAGEVGGARSGAAAPAEIGAAAHAAEAGGAGPAVGLGGRAAAAGLGVADRAPEEWDEREVAAVVERMRGADGVAVQDRRHLLTLHPRCFVGREAVDWLVAHEGLTRAEAMALGERLVALGLIHHVLDEHGFRDAHLFYRFRADDPA
jgi:small-conductance mechanosensitive channel